VNIAWQQRPRTEYEFKNIKGKVCTGITLGFSASRDGKPFSIRILAATGEFEKFGTALSAI